MEEGGTRTYVSWSNSFSGTYASVICTPDSSLGSIDKTPSRWSCIGQKVGMIVPKMSEFVIPADVIDEGFNEAVHREGWNINLVDHVWFVDSRHINVGIERKR
jgi:hypothetical protein